MFLPLLYQLRAAGVPVGVGEFLSFLDALRQGLMTDVDELYRIGRAILCRTEADYDAWDVAFAQTFREAVLDEDTRKKLEDWLARARQRASEERVDPGWTDEELWKELMDRLSTQTEAHHGGNHWIGTGGTSPFGHGGRASRGIRVGGQGGGRSAISVAGERRWAGYRTDTSLETRDFAVALKALRQLVREGREVLDLDETIQQTAREAGEVTLVERPEKENQVRLVLMMDAGGSMAPHARRVEQLFSAAEEVKTFRSFQSYTFHNCVYTRLWTDMDSGEWVPTADVLRGLSPQHRLILVGDASMAPWELFHGVGWGVEADDRASGLTWLQRLKSACPSSIWLNPDSRRYWDHPTVDAIARVFPMFPLTLEGLREGVATLRMPV